MVPSYRDIEVLSMATAAIAMRTVQEPHGLQGYGFDPQGIDVLDINPYDGDGRGGHGQWLRSQQRGHRS